MGHYLGMSELKGKILKSWSKGYDYGEILFTMDFEDGDSFAFVHYQDCCESVWLDDICGDMDNLIGDEILLAEEISENCEEAFESGTWTFYKLGTVKDRVTLTFRGESNGYYSESVDLVDLSKKRWNF